MTVRELAEIIGARMLAREEDLEREVTAGYACDLLSWVMSHGTAGTAWTTVQTHLNVVAVATLLDLACIIVPEGIDIPEATVEKAMEEQIPMLSSDKTAYEIAGLMMARGIPPTKK